MPQKRAPTIATKLAPVDHERFEQFCRMKDKTKTELARAAILFYMEHNEDEFFRERDSLIEQRLKSMEDRFGGLMAKIGVGVFGLEHLFWTRTEQDFRKQLFQDCYVAGVRKMRNKLKPEEEDLRRGSGKG
jgi:diketogulonate reductase-like aldo/keto reductase